MLANPFAKYDIKSVKLLNLSDEIPTLSLNSSLWIRNQNGTYSAKNKGAYVFNYDASRINGASRIVVEVSKPDFYWEYFTGSYRQKKLADKKLRALMLNRLSGAFTLDASTFPCPADYQVHIAAVDASGKVCGYVSEPVTIHVE